MVCENAAPQSGFEKYAGVSLGSQYECGVDRSRPLALEPSHVVAAEYVALLVGAGAVTVSVFLCCSSLSYVRPSVICFLCVFFLRFCVSRFGIAFCVFVGS